MAKLRKILLPFWLEEIEKEAKGNSGHWSMRRNLREVGAKEGAPDQVHGLWVVLGDQCLTKVGQGRTAKAVFYMIKYVLSSSMH